MNLRVVTATRGDSKYWPATVDSLAAASGAEHVVVCPSWFIDGVRAAAPAARVIAENESGLYVNLAAGLVAFPGDWNSFTWINDDDLLLAPGFALARQFLEEDGADIVFGRVRLIDGSGRRIGELPVARRGTDVGALWAHGIIPFAQPGTLIRRHIWDKVGGFDLSYRNAGDLDFFVRAHAAGGRFAFVDAEVAAFRLSAGQLSKRREEVEAESARALRIIPKQSASRAAWWRFRLGNLGVYFRRIRRYGWVSMRELYDRTE